MTNPFFQMKLEADADYQIFYDSMTWRRHTHDKHRWWAFWGLAYADLTKEEIEWLRNRRTND